MLKRMVLPITFAVLMACLPDSASARQNHPVLDAPGFQQNRDYFSQMSFENVDTLSGALILRFTDLVLPGNARAELRFERTYNSKTRTWSFGIAGMPLKIVNPVRPPNTLGITSPQDLAPTLFMSDGSFRKLAWYQQPTTPSVLDKAISSDFWLFDRTGTTRRLSIPNGTKCDYVEQAEPTELLVSQCIDAFSNAIDFAWSSDPRQLTVTQHLSNVTSRTITIQLDPTSGLPQSLTYDGRTWQYELDDTWHQNLLSVTPPEGPGWTFAYGSNNSLDSVTNPHGGVVSYVYDDIPYAGPDPLEQYSTWVVTNRSISDSGGSIGTWTYNYNIISNGLSSESTVDLPAADGAANRRIVYSYEAAGDPADVFDGDAGVVALDHRIVQEEGTEGWIDVEREDRTYAMVSVLSYVDFGTLEPESVTTTRYDGGTGTDYLTEFEYATANFGDYHHPSTITETGPAGTRTTTRTYQSLPALYILALPSTESVTVGTETFSKSWTYDSSNGFRTAETLFGITTQFRSDTRGNLRSMQKANHKSTLFQYQNGQLSVIATPEYSVQRSINADGTIATETRGGRTTSFSYDDLGRTTAIQAPGGTNPTFIDYDSDGRWVRTTRGASPASVNSVNLDAFGRQVETIDPMNVRATTRYSAEGRTVYEGYPYRTGDTQGGVDIGTSVAHDALGRVTTRTSPDSSYVSFTYGANATVIRTDENGHSSVQTWKAFGNPNDALLTSVTDPDGHTWDYTYNALGKLLTVALDAVQLRAWTYYANGLLYTETHPESGTTTYSYDAVGNLTEKVDAKGKHTTYAYDGNDRTRTITADGRVTVFSYQPGTDNRTSAVNGADGVFWQYDALTGRLQSRQDAIGGKGFTTTYEYDGNDNLTVIQYPSGRRVDLTVNAAGQPTRIREAAANRNYADSILYHASGGVASYTSGNGVTTSIDYDASRYWTTNIAAGSLEIGYGDYDFVGNPQTVTTSSTGSTFNQALTYDVLDRLHTATGPQGTSTYSYDAHGNRAGSGYTLNTTTLRLSNDGGVAVTYDNNGNALTIGGATFTYTPQNQIETVANLGNTATYAYDGDDQRVKKDSAGSTTYYIRGFRGELLTEWKDPGTANGKIRDYIYLGSRLLSAVDRPSSSDPTGFNIPSTVSHSWSTSWQVTQGNGDSVTLDGGISAAARKSFHPDMPSTGLRLGIRESSVETLINGPLFANSGTNSGSPKQGGIFVEFQVERRPYTADAQFLGVRGGGTIDDIAVYLTPSGSVLVKNEGGRVTPITVYSSPTLALGTTHSLELQYEYNSFYGPFVPPNPAWESLTSRIQVFLDGDLVGTYGAGAGGSWSSGESTTPVGLDWQTSFAWARWARISSPPASAGLLMSVFRAGTTSAATHGNTLDTYGSQWRTTLLEVAGQGTYSEWTGGQPDWRAHSAMGDPNGVTNVVTTDAGNKKVSYQIESMLGRGITGNIGTVLVGVRNAYITNGSQVFIRRNGVDTMLPGLTLASNPSNIMRWYRVSQGGWSPSDTIEVGLMSGASGLNYLSSFAVMVEHNTPEPEPLTDTSARVVTVNYSGNGTGQTVDLGLDMVPTVLLVMPATGASGVEPLIWWNTRLGASSMSVGTASFAQVWPQRGKFQVVHPSAGDSFNASGANYTAIAVFDPSGRFVIPFAVSKAYTEDNYTHTLRYPQTGQVASDFTPNFVFGGIADMSNGDATFAALYRGPGHTGDLTAKLGVAQASDADRIQTIAAGQVQLGASINNQTQQDTSFWAGRVSDGVVADRLMAVTSYVGNGTTSRNIALSLDGQSPVFALVVPTTAVAKVYRVSTDTTGRQTSTGAAVANSITAMGADQITVGSALNATGVTYDVWAIRTGLVEPQ